MIFRAETPVDVRKDWLRFKVDSSEYPAAYFRFPPTRSKLDEKRGLSAFSTFLMKKYVGIA